MRARLASMPRRTQIFAALGVVLVYVLAAWFLLVSPKQAEASAVEEEVAAAELRLIEAQVTAARPNQVVGARVSDVLRLAKAMPPSSEQSSLVLELELLGDKTGVAIESIALGDPVVAAGAPTSIPVIVSAEGSYRQFSRFLTRVRGLVAMRGGAIAATGRLFTVQGVELSESKVSGFPRLAGIVTLNAFVYDGPIVPVTPPPAVDGTDDGTDSTSTAAGATP